MARDSPSTRQLRRIHKLLPRERETMKSNGRDEVWSLNSLVTKSFLCKTLAGILESDQVTIGQNWFRSWVRSGSGVRRPTCFDKRFNAPAFCDPISPDRPRRQKCSGGIPSALPSDPRRCAHRHTSAETPSSADGRRPLEGELSIPRSRAVQAQHKNKKRVLRYRRHRARNRRCLLRENRPRELWSQLPGARELFGRRIESPQDRNFPRKSARD